VFENRVLRRICGPKREEVTEWLRKSYDEMWGSHSWWWIAVFCYYSCTLKMDVAHSFKM
jgi:hypothetical protein